MAFFVGRNTYAFNPEDVLNVGQTNLLAYSSLSWSAGAGAISFNQFGRAYPSKFNATIKVVVPNSMFVCGVGTWLGKNGSPVGSVSMSIYDDEGGDSDPKGGNVIVTSANVYDSSDLTNNVGQQSTTHVIYYFTGYDCQWFNGTDVIYIVFEKIGGSPDSSHFYSIAYDHYTGSFPYDDLPNLYPAGSILSNKGNEDSTSSDDVAYFEFYGYSDLSVQNYSPTASDSWFNLSGARTYCDSAFPIATGASASWFNLNIQNNLCQGFGFLFIPNGQKLTESYGSVKNELVDRIPTSYFLQFAALLNDSLVASSSQRFNMNVALNLNILGFHSSQSFAPLSSASVNVYAGSWLPTIRLIMEYVLYIGWAFLWYHIGKNKFKVKSS